MQIFNGFGTLHPWRIWSDGKGDFRGTSKTLQQEATDEEDSYNINTGIVINAVSTEQAILFLKNNESRNFHITGIVAITGVCTNGTETRFKMYKNVSDTAGTIITEAIAGDVNSNRNFGSNNSFSATFYKGDGSAVISGGTVHIDSIIAPSLARVFFDIDEVLTPGDNTAVTLEIAANDSNTNCMVAIIGHLENAAK